MAALLAQLFYAQAQILEEFCFIRHLRFVRLYEQKHHERISVDYGIIVLCQITVFQAISLTRAVRAESVHDIRQLQ